MGNETPFVIYVKRSQPYAAGNDSSGKRRRKPSKPCQAIYTRAAYPAFDCAFEKINPNILPVVSIKFSYALAFGEFLV